MSRHRNIRNISYEDELCEDFGGRSLDEVDYCVSPATEAEFMFRRDKHHTLSSFIGDEEKIDEEEEEAPLTKESFFDNKRPTVNHSDEEKLHLCIEHLQDILGETYDEDLIAKVVINQNFDMKQALNQLLNKGHVDTAPTKNMTPSKTEYFTGKTNSTTPKTKKEKQEFKEKQEVKGADDVRGGLKGTPVIKSRENLLDNDFNSATKTPKNLKSREVIDVSAELEKRQDGKELINLVVIGHVDAGKSTLMGHLLFKLGKVSQKSMHKNEMESKKLGKGSFAFAWVLDETEEERARGITMDVAMTVFETKTKIVTLMDAPGHRDFIPNMIQGTSQADVAILVIDARPGEFESGFDAGGQTREHAVLARSLGVGQLIVAINKMDAVNWSKDRYDNIVLKLKTFLLKQAGFRESDVCYIPCSGLSGENLVSNASEKDLIKWYKDGCIVDLIDSFFRAPKRAIDRPFRLCISDVYKGQGSFIVAGKVESGSVQNGDKIMLMPAADAGMIKGLSTRDEPVNFVAAGDHVTASIHGVDMTHVNVGSIICDFENPIKVSTRIVARIVVFNISIPITKGFMVVYHSQNACDPATISKLVSILNKSSGEVVQKRPRCLTKHMNAVVELKFQRPVCIEKYSDNKVLGRFMLRYSGDTIAAGVVTEIK
uniref:HBS1-like protein n=1 Tax=Hydra vulgaris TaxID=6087 RepID=T2M2X7_HYDVU